MQTNKGDSSSIVGTMGGPHCRCSDCASIIALKDGLVDPKICRCRLNKLEMSQALLVADIEKEKLERELKETHEALDIAYKQVTKLVSQRERYGPRKSSRDTEQAKLQMKEVRLKRMRRSLKKKDLSLKQAEEELKKERDAFEKEKAALEALLAEQPGQSTAGCPDKEADLFNNEFEDSGVEQPFQGRVNGIIGKALIKLGRRIGKLFTRNRRNRPLLNSSSGDLTFFMDSISSMELVEAEEGVAKEETKKV